MKMKKLLPISVAVATIGLSSSNIFAAEKLNVICSASIDWCQLMVNEFEKETGVNVKMTRKSSGETFAQLRAEKRNPKVDVWWGGTGDPHLQAAEEGITYKYQSPNLNKLPANGGSLMVTLSHYIKLTLYVDNLFASMLATFLIKTLSMLVVAEVF